RSSTDVGSTTRARCRPGATHALFERRSKQMGWEPERNRFSLSPHDRKAAEGYGARTVHDPNSVPGSECPPGILSARPLNPDPHGGGPRANVYMPSPSASKDPRKV